MHPCVYHLSIVSATLLLSLASPLQLAGIPLGINAASAQEQTTQELLRNPALVRYHIGVEQLKKGEFRDALQTFETVLSLFRAIGDRQSEGVTLNTIGFVYENLGQYPQALKSYEQALVIHKEIGNKVEEGTTLNNIGEIYRKLGKYANALQFYEQALVIAKQAGNKTHEGRTLNSIGLVYDARGRYEC
jgi:tetratricopeptide (TPR) repeat protein